MKSFTMKLQEYKRKFENTKKEIKKRYKVFKIKTKVRIAYLIRKIDRMMGFEQRCSLCEEKLFCEEYAYKRHSKHPLYVDRCYTRESQR